MSFRNLSKETTASEALLEQINDWDGNILFREGKIAEMRAELADLSGKKAEKLADKIEKWEGLIDSTADKADIARLELSFVDGDIVELSSSIADHTVWDVAPYKKYGTTPYDPPKGYPLVDEPSCGCVTAP